MIEQFRKLIKEAAPHVLKAMLADISAESNRIFGEIMGDRSAYLSWRTITRSSCDVRELIAALHS